MDWHFDEGPIPNNDFDHVAYDGIRFLGSVEELDKKYGKLKFAISLIKQALSEIDEAEIEFLNGVN